MKVKNVTKWIGISDVQAASLFDVITGKVSKNTTVGREAWRSLINASFFQENCNLQGLNVQPASSSYGNYVKVRIGIVANNQDNCNSCDSCVGFGILIRSCGGYDLASKSCGASKAGCYGNLNTNMVAFGYILVQ